MAPDDIQLAKRKRALAAGALISLAIFAVVALLVTGGGTSGNGNKVKSAAGATAVTATPKSIPIERLVLKPVSKVKTTKKGGVAEVARIGNKVTIRIIAAGLEPTTKATAYGVVIGGGNGPPKRLGQAITDKHGTMLGASPVTLELLAQFRNISVYLQPLGSSTGSLGTLVLRGALPG